MALSESDMTGDQLVHINQLVIKMWGIKDNKDCMSLIGHIRGLVDQNAGLGLAQEAVKEKEGAITDFDLFSDGEFFKISGSLNS